MRVRKVLCAMGAALLIVGSATTPANAAPAFQMPFPCGEVWHASTYGGHNAIDWNAYPEDNGRPVVASLAGNASLGYDHDGWGYYVTVDHGGGWQTRYAHLHEHGRISGPVSQGQTIGYVGSTGDSSAPHLHWEQIQNGNRQATLYENGAAINPGTSYTASDPSYTSSNSCSSPPVHVDLAWKQGARIYTFRGPGFATVGSVNGITTGTEMFVGDVNGDGKDDIIQFLGTAGELNVLLSNGNTFYSHPNNPIRGPGVGTPVWAGAGDFGN